MKIVMLASVCIIALSLTACSTINEDKSPTKAPQKAKFRNSGKSKKSYHDDMETSSTPVSGSPVLAALKSNHLGVSSTTTIGEAFDSYTYGTKIEWRETPTTSGPYYIDVICRLPVRPLSSVALKEGVVKRALEIKFAIQKDGVTYIAMARRVEIRTDGMEHTIIIEPVDINRIVADIYGNREIVF